MARRLAGGRLVADADKRDWDELTGEYGAMLMKGLGLMAVGEAAGAKRVKVLQHLMGFLKNHLSSEDNAYQRCAHRSWVCLQ